MFSLKSRQRGAVDAVIDTNQISEHFKLSSSESDSELSSVTDLVSSTQIFMSTVFPLALASLTPAPPDCASAPVPTPYSPASISSSPFESRCWTTHSEWPRRCSIGLHWLPFVSTSTRPAPVPLLHSISSRTLLYWYSPNWSTPRDSTRRHSLFNFSGVWNVQLISSVVHLITCPLFPNRPLFSL